MDHALAQRVRSIAATIRNVALCVIVTAGAAAAEPALHSAPIGHIKQHAKRLTFTTPIQHIIVIVQENRSVDNLFNGWTSSGGNADTVMTDPVSGLPLRQCSLDEQDSTGCPPNSGVNKKCDISHAHEGSFDIEYGGGFMNGFNDPRPPGPNCSFVNNESPTFSYVPPAETTQYWGFAQQYAFVNHAMQANSGPSFPSHQYLIAGQAGGLTATGEENTPNAWSIAENATKNGGHSCLSPGATANDALDLRSAYPGNEQDGMIAPCNGYLTIFDLLNVDGLKWKYYTNQEDGLWGGPAAVNRDCNGINPITGLCNSTSIIQCSPQALLDFMATGSAGLPNLTYVIPNNTWSDHPVSGDSPAVAGPNWVTWLVNSIGTSSYWNSTTIIVTWDDWGGWFDHWQPPSGAAPNMALINCATNGMTRTPESCGFRVPMIVIGPYVKHGYVDTTPTVAAGSILRYIEHSFGLPQLTGSRSSTALGSADTWTTDDLMNTMAFGAPRPYVGEPTSLPSTFFTGNGCNSPSYRVDTHEYDP